MCRIVERANIDAPMRRKLSAVHQAWRPGWRRLRRQAVNIAHVTSDVGAAGDGNQLDPPRMRLEQAIEMSLVQATDRVDADVLDAGSRPPGQVVAIMLQLRDQHHGLGHQRYLARQVVDAFRRVLAKPYTLFQQLCSDKRPYNSAPIPLRLLTH